MKLTSQLLQRACLALAALGLASCQSDKPATSARPPGEADYTSYSPPPLRAPSPAGASAVAATGTARPAEYLMAMASMFRAEAAADMDQALRHFGSAEALDFLQAAPAAKECPGCWSYFFATSIPVIGDSSQGAWPAAVAAFYNPLLDAVLLTRWRIDANGQGRIVAGQLRSGQELAAGRLANTPALPAWMVSDQAAPVALAGQYRSFLAAFSQFATSAARAWAKDAQASPATRDHIAALAAGQLAGLSALNKSGPAAGALAELRGAIAAGDAESLARMLPAGNPLGPKALAELPKPLREHLTPVHVVCDDQHIMVFLADTRLLRFYAVAVFDVRGKAQPTSLAIFDLMHSPNK